MLLYYFTTTRPARNLARDGNPTPWHNLRFGPHVYAARRRTMAMCNLLAFVVFTLWPCMPPRLLSDPSYDGPGAEEAKRFGFVDTVHGAGGESSVWTTNRFCNQYGTSEFRLLLPTFPLLKTDDVPQHTRALTDGPAAMPSLHFGYSLHIGLTVAAVPVSGPAAPLRRAGLVVLGAAYPLAILATIIATANHFVLDAAVGATVCGLAWAANGLLLNLLAAEDYFLWAVRVHKPVVGVGRGGGRL